MCGNRQESVVYCNYCVVVVYMCMYICACMYSCGVLLNI